MSIHEQALIHGSVSNVSDWTAAGMLELLVVHLEKGTFQVYPGWQDRLINNYYQCLVKTNHDPLSIHYGINGRHILLRIFDVVSKSSSVTVDALIAIYLSQFEDIQLGLMADDVKNNGGNTLTRMLFGVINGMMNNDTLRNWFTTAQKPIKSSSAMLVGLGLKPSENKRITFTTENFITAIMIDNLGVLAGVQRAPSTDSVIVQRAKQLLIYAPLYWSKVKQWYTPNVQRISMPLDDIKELGIINGGAEIVKLPTGIEIKDLMNFTPHTWNLWKLSATRRAYVLGFPIQFGTPGVKTLKEAIFKLARDGPDEYARTMAKQGSSLVEYIYPGLVDASKEDKDGMGGDDIVGQKFGDYGPFDRISYMDDDILFQFTRPGWDDMIKTGKNPYNKSNLTTSFKKEVQARLEIAKLYDLGPSKPLVDLLKETRCTTVTTLPLPDETHGPCGHTQHEHNQMGMGLIDAMVATLELGIPILPNGTPVRTMHRHHHRTPSDDLGDDS